MTDTLRALDPAKWHLAGLIKTTIDNYVNGLSHIEFTVEQIELYQFLEQPKEKEFGDFSLPCFRFSKPLKTAPAAIAQHIKDTLDAAEDLWISKIDVKAAFLNFYVNTSTMATHTLPLVKNGHFFEVLSSRQEVKDNKIMIEYSQPNTHKEFHVGHGRNVCLGESITNIHKYCGFDVIPVNYIGDEGTHVAKCLWKIFEQKDQIPESNRPEWYNARYVEANQALKEASGETLAKYQSIISNILAEIESKDGPYYELWLTTKQDCMESFYEIYKWLGVSFDHYFYESDVSEDSQKIVEEFIQKGLFKESDGAYGIDMKPYKLGYFMARKSDGNTLYITKDLALARKKFEDFGVNTSIYVVADEQIFHFKQLFKCLELMGFEQAKNSYHLSYGMVVRKEGKMSSREGNSFTFLQLKSLVENELRVQLKKYEDRWSKDKIDHTAHLLAKGSIKYGMLSSDPNKEIVFDESAWVSFEGNSGPYQMYAYARAKSILEKAKAEGLVASYDNLELLKESVEKNLLRELYNFNNVVLSACTAYRPSTIANYIYDISKLFNRFYTEAPILKLDDKQLQSARLALIETFATMSKKAQSLLGIEPPDKM